MWRWVRAGGLALTLLLAGSAPAAAAASDTTDSAASQRLEELAHARFGPSLSAAELKMVRTAPLRNVAWVGANDDPESPSNDPSFSEQWGPERTIRAELLAWLVTDPECAKHIHPSGVGIAGARIQGDIDLSYMIAAKPITLISSSIGDGINLENAHLDGLAIRRSRIGPIVADLSEVAHDVTLTFDRTAHISMFRAKIGGTIDCTGTQVIAAGDIAVNAVESMIGGDVLFHDGFQTDGTIDLRLAKIDHDLSFNDVAFNGTEEDGLNAERAHIAGTFYWVGVRHGANTALDLEGASARALWDDAGSWPSAGNLTLNGFVYGELLGGPTDAASRLRWLELQPAGYWPQPYRQLSTVLRDDGHDGDAADVAIASLVEQRRSGGLPMLDRVWNRLLQITIGYGYRPLRALWWIAAFVLFGTLLFESGYWFGLITPTEEAAYEQFAKTGETPAHYPPFNAFVYSLENFLPVVELGQDPYWRPNPRHGLGGSIHPGGVGAASGTVPAAILRWYLWAHVIAGWMITPLLFAGLSGLVRPN